MSCNFYLSGGLFAGMLGKALFRWKKGRLKLCLFSLEIGKTGVIVKNRCYSQDRCDFFFLYYSLNLVYHAIVIPLPVHPLTLPHPIPPAPCLYEGAPPPTHPQLTTLAFPYAASSSHQRDCILTTNKHFSVMQSVSRVKL